MFLLDSARETLVLLGIVVLKADLKLHSFVEFTLLLNRLGEDSVDCLVQSITRDFRPLKQKEINDK